MASVTTVAVLLLLELQPRPGAQAPASMANGLALNLRDGGYVLLSFISSVEGIPAAVLPNIFNPFFTTNAVGKGSGFGLSVTYIIVSDARTVE